MEERHALHHPHLPRPEGAFVHGISVQSGGRLLFLSGVTARDAKGDILGVGDPAQQVRVVFDHMADILRADGAILEDIVKLTVFVRDMAHWAAITAERRRRFPNHLPAATMVEVSRFVHAHALLEVEAIAHLPASRTHPDRS